MTTYVIIETSDIEIMGVHVRLTRESADAAFKQIADENQASEWPLHCLTCEAEGTLRLAGDDVYAVQLLEVKAA